MSRKIKFHTFHFLFRLFAYLADKSGGWRVFVRPKLLLGSLIVGLGLTACGTKTENKPTEKRAYPNSSKKEISKTDSISSNKNNSTPAKLVKCYTGSVITKDKIDDKSSKAETLARIKSTNDSTFTSCYLQISVKDVDIDKKPVQEDKNKVYVVLQQMPEFPTGNDSLLSYVSKNLKWPNTDSDVQGKVVCRFVVNTDGSISDIEIIRSLDPLFDAEAIRVIKTLPNFIPGELNGKVVRAYYTIPVIFRTE